MQTDRVPVREDDKEYRPKYCEYHKWAGHTTEECRTLKHRAGQRYEVTRRNDKCREENYRRRDNNRSPPPDQRRRSRTPERRVQNERRDKAATSGTSRQERAPRRSERERESQCSAVVRHGFINMISGGLSGGGESSNARKRHLKQCMAISSHLTGKRLKPTEVKKPNIVWDEDEIDVIPDHDDPLVIQAVIANFGVNRVFVDHGSSADILFLPCFQALGLSVKDLTPVKGDLLAFNSTATKPLGMIELRMSLGTPPTSKSVNVQFLVLDVQSAYNAILGRRVLAALGPASHILT